MRALETSGRPKKSEPCRYMVSAVPRYFFILCGSNGDISTDHRGVVLPDVQAARLHADRMIKKLREQSGYDDPSLTIQVKDEAGQTILFLPVIPVD